MRFCEKAQIVTLLTPYDMSDGAGTGRYVSLKGYDHVVLKFTKDVGSSSEDAVLTIQQATAVAGTNAKSLTFTDIYVKTSNAGTFTKTTQAAAATYTATGASEQVLCVEFDADSLDVDGGFDCVTMNVSDSGSSSGAYGTVEAILLNPRYSGDPTPTAITD